MDDYLGITYLKDGMEELTEEELGKWKLKYCPKGEHLWDEVLSIDSHYLYCDACGVTKKL